jgi:putative ABC transport system permease protein
MKNWKLWLRWSWRDLRARWLQVIAIALIIALGTGVFAGLGGQKAWRIRSLDASYERLNAYDLRMQLADGSYVDQAALLAALAGVDGVETLETRLIVPTLVDASHDSENVLVQGRMVGVDITGGGPHINSLYIYNGRNFVAEDAGENTVIVETQFAHYYHLKPGDPIRISGGATLNFVGTAQSPEYFAVVPDNGTFLGEASLAVLFMPLSTVQTIAGRAGLVNNVVFRLADGVNADAVRAEIENRMAGAFPAVGTNLTDLEDDYVRMMLYTDARGDQTTWDLIAALFLIGASLGAFNLAGRIVESQRRQIGISMALGLPRPWIAFRPMLVGLQIALFGTLFGLAAGYLLGRLFAELFQSLLPLPYWDFSLYVPGYVRATLLGILLPLVATLIPVWRAVRGAPIDSIRAGNLIAKGGGLSWIMNYISIPGKSFMQMPFRNILRSPWRSLLTVFGIAIAVLLLTVFIGFLDTFTITLNQASDAYLYQRGDRLVVALDFFYPADSPQISDLTGLTDEGGQPLFTMVDTDLIAGGKLLGSDDDIDVSLEFLNMDNAIWVPGLLKGHLKADKPGIIISEKAAEDLGVGVGDTVTLEHPRREGLLAFRLAQTELPVIGIHNNPIRALSYLDTNSAEIMGLAGTTNYLVVEPAKGVTADEVKLALLNQPGVASVLAISEFSNAFQDTMKLFTSMLRVIQAIVLIMAFLIAFNSTSINIDERVREISTMFAFGLPIRTVTRMQIIENLVIGALGTAVGVALGWEVLKALLVARVEEQLADFKFIVTISTTTLVTSIILGLLVVALTPLLSIRRMARMNIPDTLRVME